MSYADRLKDPRWQRRRLERLNAANWKCVDCGDGKSSLHVHHTRYFAGRMPWDYPDNMLLVLCDTCHGAHHGKVRAPTRLPPLRRNNEPEFVQLDSDWAGYQRAGLQLVDAELKRLFDNVAPTAQELCRARQLVEMRSKLKTIDLDAIKASGANAERVSKQLLAQHATLQHQEVVEHFRRPEL